MTILSLRLERLRAARVVGALLLALAPAACDWLTEPDPVPASIRLSEPSLSLADGGSDTLTATVLDRSGKPLDRPVQWSSSDTAVVAVDTAGVLQARAPGTATVTASYERPGGTALAASAAVTVSPSAGAVESLSFPTLSLTGQPLESPLRFRVRDRQGKLLAGARVEFRLTRGSGTFAPDTALTDSLGIASTVLTLGPQPGEVVGEARAVGTERKAEFRLSAWRPRVVLRPDSMRVVMGLCVPDPDFVAYVYLDSEHGYSVELRKMLTVAYAVEDSTLLELLPSTANIGTSGLYRYATRLVKGRKPGTTRVIARYAGAADTAVVSVVPLSEATPGRVEAGEAVRRVVVGRQILVRAFVYERGGCPLLREQVTYTSTDPRIAQVDTLGRVALREPGEARIVAAAGGLADTVSLVVRRARVVPADTTIRVGESVTFRLFTADATGVWTEVPSSVHSFGSDVARKCTGAGCPSGERVTGIAPGTARISVSEASVYSEISVEATLRVVPP